MGFYELELLVLQTITEEGKVDTAEESTLGKESDEVVKNDSQDEAEVRREDSSEDVNDDKDAGDDGVFRGIILDLMHQNYVLLLLCYVEPRIYRF